LERSSCDDAHRPEYPDGFEGSGAPAGVNPARVHKRHSRPRSEGIKPLARSPLACVRDGGLGTVGPARYARLLVQTTGSAPLLLRVASPSNIYEAFAHLVAPGNGWPKAILYPAA